MKQQHLICLCLLLLLCSCVGEKYNPNWTVTLSHTSRQPYGSYLAHQSLKHYFPDVPVEDLSRWYRYNNMSQEMLYGSDATSLLVLNGLDFYLSGEELNILMRYARSGNEVLLFCSHLDHQLEEKLGCSKEGTGSEEAFLDHFNDGSQNLAALWKAGDSLHRYGFRGRWLKSYFAFSQMPSKTVLSGDGDAQPADTTFTENDDAAAAFPDSTYDNAGNIVSIHTDDGENTSSDDDLSSPRILGFSRNGPDFIRYKVGSGHITLHAAPLVLSNYFLIQGNNHDYLSYIWSTLPQHIGKIYWQDYYKRHGEQADMGTMFRFPATRWAILLSLMTLLLFVLFSARRRQRIIPIIPPLENSSVSFAETIGRLYYNKGNHMNLAEKMVQHFLEYIRSNYFQNTSQIDEHFITQLAIKSGQPESVVRDVADRITEVRLRSVQVDDSYLYHLHNTLQLFYKK